VSKQLNQRDNPEEFFAKYGFRCNMTMVHPEFKDSTMTFEGLEARYVQSLERQVKEQQRWIKELHEKMDWLRDREFFCYKEGMKTKDSL
jgi:predicted RNase H-like nuclease (RuvC/YqgF family)